MSRIFWFLHRFLQCEPRFVGIQWDVLEQEGSPRALILKGFWDSLGLRETSWDTGMVETRRIELLTFALRTRRSPS
jgi:hypothetical protein